MNAVKEVQYTTCQVTERLVEYLNASVRGCEGEGEGEGEDEGKGEGEGEGEGEGVM